MLSMNSNSSRLRNISYIISQRRAVIVVLSALGINSHVSRIERAARIILDAIVTVPVGSSLLLVIVQPCKLIPAYASDSKSNYRIKIAIEPILDVVDMTTSPVNTNRIPQSTVSAPTSSVVS